MGACLEDIVDIKRKKNTKNTKAEVLLKRKEAMDAVKHKSC